MELLHGWRSLPQATKCLQQRGPCLVLWGTALCRSELTPAGPVGCQGQQRRHSTSQRNLGGIFCSGWRWDTATGTSSLLPFSFPTLGPGRGCWLHLCVYTKKPLQGCCDSHHGSGIPCNEHHCCTAHDHQALDPAHRRMAALCFFTQNIMGSKVTHNCTWWCKTVRKRIKIKC